MPLLQLANVYRTIAVDIVYLLAHALNNQCENCSLVEAIRNVSFEGESVSFISIVRD